MPPPWLPPPPGSTRRAAAAVAPWLVFAALVAALLGPSLAGHQVVLPHDHLFEFLPWSDTESRDGGRPANQELRDVIDQYYPTQHALTRRLLAGQDAAWLGDVGIGYPGWAFLGWGALSPFNLTTTVLPFDQAWTWGMALRLLAAMGGAYVLARGFGIGRAAATVTGVAFGLSGYMVGWLGWPQSHVGAFVPWVWAATRVCARPGRPWWSVGGLAVATAGLWVGGFPAVAVWGLLGAAVLAAHTVGGHRWAGWRAQVGGSAAVAGGVLAGTALVAFTLLPTVLMLDQFDLGARTQMWQARVPLAALVTFVAPGYFGDVVSRDFWLPSAYVETVGYAGVVTLALALPAWVLAPRRSGVWVVTGLAAVSIGVAYGAVPWLLARLPLLSTNPPPRVLVVAGLSVALLGGFGADALVRWVGGWLRLTRWTLVRALALVLAGVAVWAATRPDRWLATYAGGRIGEPAVTAAALQHGAEQLVEAAVLVSVAAVLVVATRLVAVPWRALGAGILAVGLVGLVAVDLGRFAAGWNPHTPREELFPAAPGLDAAADTSGRHRVATANEAGLPNTHLEYGFSDLRYHGFLTRRHREVLRRAGAQFASATLWDLDATDSANWEPWLTVMGAKAVLAPAWVEVLPGPRAPAQGEVPSGPLGATGVWVSTDVPRDGTVDGVQVRVGDFGLTDNVGALEAHVRSAGTSGTGRVGLPGLPSGRPVMIPVPPVDVTEGDRVRVRLTGDIRDMSGIAVYGVDVGGRFVPTVGLRFDDDPAYEAVDHGPVRLFVNEHAPERVYAVGSARGVRPGDAVEVVESLAPAEVATTAVVEAMGDTPLSGLPDGGVAAVTRWTEDGGTVRADVAAEDGAVLVVLQEALDGWRATLDGRPVDLVRANHLFVGVVVPPGGGVVELRYVPAGLSTGVAVSLVAALSLLLWSAVGWWRSRRAARTASAAAQPAAATAAATEDAEMAGDQGDHASTAASPSR